MAIIPTMPYASGDCIFFYYNQTKTVLHFLRSKAPLLCEKNNVVASKHPSKTQCIDGPTPIIAGEVLLQART